MKCGLCSKTIAELFLKKLKGTHIRDGKGKLHTICFECQKKIKTKKEMLEKLHAPVA